MTYHYDSAGETLHVVFDADVLSTNADVLGATLCDALGESSSLKLLDLDMRQTQMIDSAGLSLLVSTVRAVRARGGRVRAQVENANIQRILIFTRLDRHLEVVKNPGASDRR